MISAGILAVFFLLCLCGKSWLESAVLMVAFTSAGVCQAFCRCSGTPQGGQVFQPAGVCRSDGSTGFRSFSAFELSLHLGKHA